MRRLALGERPDWRETATANGFVFHTLDGAPYWDERHAYAFTLDEIERDIEAPSAELHALCLDFAARAVEDERILASLRIPESAWDAIRGSWRRGDPSLYGRLDFSYGGAGAGPAKLLEYNADTPTALYETGVFQWLWLEDGLRDGRLPKGSDQFNAVHERLIARFRDLAVDGLIAFTAYAEAPEDKGTVDYLRDCALQAGCRTAFVDLPELGLREDGHFCIDADTPIATLFKLYPWEWAFRDSFAEAVVRTPTRFLEPPWKAVLSNKGLMPHLWRMAPGHPNLLPAFFEDEPAKASLGTSFVRKPLYSREGSNILIVRDGSVLARGEGPYGGEGFVRQALAELPDFEGRRPLVGSWMIGDEPSGLCVREGGGPITGDDALFVPHLIEPECAPAGRLVPPTVERSDTAALLLRAGNDDREADGEDRHRPRSMPAARPAPPALAPRSPEMHDDRFNQPEGVSRLRHGPKSYALRRSWRAFGSVAPRQAMRSSLQLSRDPVSGRPLGATCDEQDRARPRHQPALPP